MKRLWTMLMVTFLVLTIALPAGAVKPPKPPKPSTSAPVSVSLDADPIWVHEAGDVIWYDVTVQNKTRDEVTATVTWTDGSTDLTIIEPRGVVTFPDLFSHTVTEAEVVAGIDIVGTVTVTSDSGTVTAKTSTIMDPVDPCDFDALVGGEVCIWQPTTPGEWTITATPDPVPTRPTNLAMTMRDGVPGNWCTLQDFTGGTVQERWLPKSPTSIDLKVYLPDGDGECLLGGAGVCTEDDCYFAVGNPESFYLYTSFDGTATLTSNS